MEGSGGFQRPGKVGGLLGSVREGQGAFRGLGGRVRGLQGPGREGLGAFRGLGGWRSSGVWEGDSGGSEDLEGRGGGFWGLGGRFRGL